MGNSWQPQVSTACSRLGRAARALFSFIQKDGRGTISPYLKIYRLHAVPTATHGAGAWEYHNVSPIQVEENRIGRWLLNVPPFSTTYILHSELNLEYVTDSIELTPLLLWVSVLVNSKANFNRDVILDCLSQDKSLCIPWQNYVNKTLAEIGIFETFPSPKTICKSDKRLVKSCYAQFISSQRTEASFSKHSTRIYFIILSTGNLPIFQTLEFTRWERALLFRCRSGTVSNMLSRGWKGVR